MRELKYITRFLSKEKRKIGMEKGVVKENISRHAKRAYNTGETNEHARREMAGRWMREARETVPLPWKLS